jgi:hypothetical protein
MAVTEIATEIENAIVSESEQTHTQDKEDAA